MAKNIQDLRREAGYRNAKDFAAALGIAASTYNRYESQPDAIPLRQAWAIADFLGCSIDMVVGREPVEAGGMRGDVQRFYDNLSDEGRRLMDDHMDFVAHREKEAAKRARVAERSRYEALLDRYLRAFDAQARDAEPFGVVAEYDGSDAGRRSSFERFLADTAAAKLDAGVREHLRGLEEELRGGYLDADGNEHSLTDEQIAEQLDAERTQLTIEYEPRDREVIGKIMGAYDERYARAERYWLEYLADGK